MILQLRNPENINEIMADKGIEATLKYEEGLAGHKFGTKKMKKFLKVGA